MGSFFFLSEEDLKKKKKKHEQKLREFCYWKNIQSFFFSKATV